MKRRLVLCALALTAALVAAGERKAQAEIEALPCPVGYVYCCTIGSVGCVPNYKCFKPCKPD